MSLLDTAATLLLSPLLLAQAIRLRKIALQLPEASGPRTGSLGNGPSLRLLIIGDSSAAGVGAQTQDEALAGQLVAALSAHHTVHWQLIAATRATTASTLAKLKTLPHLPQADIALMILGVNDVTRGGPQSLWLRTHASLRRLVRTQTGAKRLYVGQIPPLGAFPLLPNPLRWLLGRRATRFDAALRSVLARYPLCAPPRYAGCQRHGGRRISSWSDDLCRLGKRNGPPDHLRRASLISLEV